MNHPEATVAASRIELGQQLAAAVESRLSKALEEKGRAILALSGGSTPEPFLKALQTAELDWSSIVITLVDERWVPAEHALSNHRLLRENLLAHIPDAAFVPLFAVSDSVDESLPVVLREYCRITNSSLDAPASFDAVVLGMGGDGHTASFFPDAPNIEQLVDLKSAAALLTCESPSTQVPRITWSAPQLLNTRFLALHFCGQDKWAVYQAACESGATVELPIRVAIHQSQTPLNVYYAD